VGQRTPEEIRISGQALTVLQRVLRAPAPQEGCALLLGHTGPAAWSLQRIWPCLNVWQPAQARTHRFKIDPREQLLAQKWARQRGLVVLGSAHSHPAAPPLPSATDRALGFGPTLMLILGCAAAEEPDLQCWWLPDPVAGEQAPPHRLMWRMEG
jgi:[CysO sulfur-carrier protein]-S-L-cysteine hydrolase